MLELDKIKPILIKGIEIGHHLHQAVTYQRGVWIKIQEYSVDS